MRLTLDTPENVLDMSEKEILDLCVGNPNGLPVARRLFVVKHLFKAMKLDLTGDIALGVVSSPAHKMLIAGAGAGKSTVIHASILINKAEHSLVTGKRLSGNRILFLAFNDNNIADMKATHARLVSNIHKSRIQGFEIDDKIDARTFHSFCKSWFEEYADYLGYKDAVLEPNNGPFEDMLARILPMVQKKYEVTEPNIKEMLNLYRLALQTMIPFDSPKIYDLCPVLPCSLEALSMWFRAFEISKKSMKNYDFVDILVGFNKLTRENEKFLERIRDNFDEINLDECQDFNPVMIDSVKNLGKYLKITMIGDEDQSIYGFLGADYTVMAMFRENFSGGKIYSMFFNRRCRAKICEFGMHVVSTNTGRFDKKILPMKEGGEIHLKGYSTEEGQIIQMVNYLKSKDPKDLVDVAIGVKENLNTMILTQTFEEQGIMHNVKKGFEPYSHELYSHYVGLLKLLDSPFDPYLKRELFKVLPVSRQELASVIEDQNKNLDFSVANKHFCEIDYGALERKNGFREALKTLEIMSNMARNEPVRNYLVPLTNMLYSYYWNHRRMMLEEAGDLKKLAVYQYFTKKAFEYFNQPLMIRPVLTNFQQRKDTLKRISDAGMGVAVGTLHSYKGLESKEFHMMYMDSEIFPNLEVRGNMSEEGIIKMHESETSLAYVGITRAKDELFLWYNINRPSIFISMAEQFLSTYKPKEIVIPKLDLDGSNVTKKATETVVSKPKGIDSPAASTSIQSIPLPVELPVIESKKEVEISEIDLELDLDLDVGIPKVAEFKKKTYESPIMPAAPEVHGPVAVAEKEKEKAVAEPVKPVVVESPVVEEKPSAVVQPRQSRTTSFLKTFKL